MEYFRIFGRGQFERLRCRAFGDGLESALQLPAICTGIGGNHAAIVRECLNRFGMRARKREQAVVLVAEHFQRSEHLREPVSQPFGRIEVGRQYKAAWVVAVQLAPRCLEGRESVRKTGRAASWPRAAQHNALKRRHSADMRAVFGSKPQ